jgi:hypothetical protein
MCDLYSVTTKQATIAALFRIDPQRYEGSLHRMPVVFSDYPAPVIRNPQSWDRDDTNALGIPAAEQWRAARCQGSDNSIAHSIH